MTLRQTLRSACVIKKSKTVKYDIKSKFDQLRRIFWVLSAVTTTTIVFWDVRPGGTNMSEVFAASMFYPEAGVSRFLRSDGK
jgi:hypothetical protein